MVRLSPSPLTTKLLMYPSSFRMRAISSLSFEAGISTRECFAAIALRIRVNISAIGSVIYKLQIYDFRFLICDLKRSLGMRQSQLGNQKSKMLLPTRLNDARDLSLQRQLTKTDPAEIEFPQVTSR